MELHDHFRRDEDDAVWLTATAQRGWVVLTKDEHIRYRPLEKAAFLSSAARVFILNAGNLRAVEIGEAFAAALPKMCNILLSSQAGPFLAKVSRTGAVSVLTIEQR